MISQIHCVVRDNPSGHRPDAARMDRVPTEVMPRPSVSVATLADRFQVTLTKLDPNHPEFVVEIVDHLLRFAQQPSVSDAHFMFTGIRRLLVFRGVCDVPAAAICDQGR